MSQDALGALIPPLFPLLLSWFVSFLSALLPSLRIGARALLCHPACLLTLFSDAFSLRSVRSPLLGEPLDCAPILFVECRGLRLPSVRLLYGFIVLLDRGSSYSCSSATSVFSSASSARDTGFIDLLDRDSLFSECL